MAHKLFLVHGMGKPSENWADDVITELKSLYSQEKGGKYLYPRLAHMAFETRIEPIPITYDHIFEEVLTRWDQKHPSIEADVVENGSLPDWYQSLKATMNSAAEEPDKKSFFWTHAFDVYLYRLSKTVRGMVINHVMQKMGEEIRDISGGKGNYSVLATSLGTAVVHDTLHSLFRASRLPDGTFAGFTEQTAQANAVIMIANVSRVLQGGDGFPKVMSPNSLIRPGDPGQQGYGCLRYVNVNHFVDPFTLVMPFEDDELDPWPDPDAKKERRYVPIRPTHIHQRNIHDLLHYLKDPLVHAEVFRAIDHDDVIKPKELAKARKEFNIYGPYSEAEWKKIKRAWQDLMSFDGVDGTYKALGVLWKAAQDFEEYLDGLDDVDGPLDGGSGNDGAGSNGTSHESSGGLDAAENN